MKSKEKKGCYVRKILCLCLAVLMVSGVGAFTVPAKCYLSNAKDKETVLYIKESKEAQGKPGTRISVPISIKNNPGIMGIGLDITYDKDSLTAADVTAGDITKQGSLSTSIGGADEADVLKILWSNVLEVRQDGILINIEFDIKKDAKDGKQELTVEISPDDTFNELYENVSMVSEPMKLTISKKAAGRNEVVNSAEDNHKTGSGKILFVILGIIALIAVITVFIMIFTSRNKKKSSVRTTLPKKRQQENISQHSEISLPEQKQETMARIQEGKTDQTGSLTGLKGSNAGYTISMQDGEELIIGKVSGKANLIIADTYGDVSRKHCLIRYNARLNLYEVIDYSSNGTFLDGKTRMKTGQITMLPRGSQITIGNGGNVFRLN